jgi:hypothetical protein
VIQLTLLEAQAAIVPQPDGVRLLVVSDPSSGIQVVIPFPEDAAKAIGGQLASGVAVASRIGALPDIPGLIRTDPDGNGSS